MLAVFSQGVEGWYATPLPSHTAHFTSPRPQPCQLRRVLEAQKEVSLLGEGEEGLLLLEVVPC